MRVLLCSALLLGALGCGGEYEEDEVVVVDETEGELRSNGDPNRLVVWSNNIENMIFDWKDLVHAMAAAELRPDIFLVQQVTSQSEMNQLVAFMEQRLGVGYQGVVAQNVPDDHRFQGQVIPRPTVTTGIVFRSKRFDLVTKTSWMPFGRGFASQRKTCNERSNHSGYETIRVKLFDKVANKNVVAVSLRHWTWHPCSTKNVLEIVNGKDGGENDHPGLGSAAALHIVGGDFNDDLFTPRGNYKCWYRVMNGRLGQSDCPRDVDLGFVDPLFTSCGGSKSCVRENNGIDHIFVRRSDGAAARTSHFHEVSFTEAERASRQATGGDGPSNTEARDGYRDAGPSYSQHRARRAYVFYD
jgi:hypothetical protein